MGRKKKEEFADIEERLDDAIGTYLVKGPGTLTLEQTAVLIWHIEGRKTKAPMTKMGMLKVEQNALMKLRLGLAKYGITKLSDVIDPNGRSAVEVKGFRSSIDED